MEFTTKQNILLIRKHKNTGLTSDIVIEENDEDKNLITGEIIQSQVEDLPAGATIVFGKYSLFRLVIKGEDFYFIDVDDVIATCNYTEN